MFGLCRCRRSSCRLLLLLLLLPPPSPSSLEDLLLLLLLSAGGSLHVTVFLASAAVEGRSPSHTDSGIWKRNKINLKKLKLS